MTKRIALFIFLQIALLGCKSNTNENILVDSSKDVVDKNQSNTSKKETFTIDCGSGCAMTYEEVSRKNRRNSIEIKYKVIQYINESLEDEYFEAYIFESDENRNLISIHLDKSKENILNDSNSLLRAKLLEIGTGLYPKRTVQQVKLEEMAFGTQDEPYQLMPVPFDLKEYLNNLPNQIENGYGPSAIMEKYLVSIGYEGEKYTCFFIKNDIKSKAVIVSVSRGDSEYFLLLEADPNGFSSYKEIGRIGSEGTKYFKVDENYNVISY